MSNENPQSLDLWYKQGTFNYLKLYGSDRDNPNTGWLYVDKGSVVTRSISISDVTTLWSETSYYGDNNTIQISSLTISVVTSGVDHDQLLNYAAGEHFTVGSIDHSDLMDLLDDDHPQYGLRIGDTIWSGTHQFDSTVTVNADLTSTASIFGNEVDTNKVYNLGATLTVGESGDIELGDDVEYTMFPNTDLKINLGKAGNTFNDLFMGGDITYASTTTVANLNAENSDKLDGLHAHELDHDNLVNTHNLTSDIDHDAITNTHNLTSDIDHDTITNNHNLTTDINHDALTNFTATEHFTRGDIRSEANIWGGTQQFDSNVTFTSVTSLSSTASLIFGTSGATACNMFMDGDNFVIENTGLNDDIKFRVNNSGNVIDFMTIKANDPALILNAGTFEGSVGTPIFYITGNTTSNLLAIIMRFNVVVDGTGTGYVTYGTPSTIGTTGGRIIGHMLNASGALGLSGTYKREGFRADMDCTPLFGTFGGDYTEIGFNSLMGSAIIYPEDDFATDYTRIGMKISRGVDSLSVLLEGTITDFTNYGLYITGWGSADVIDAVGGTHDSKAIMCDGGDWALRNDDSKILVGTGDDAGIYFDATDLIIDPDIVGSGIVKIGATADDTIDAGAYKVAGTAGTNFNGKVTNITVVNGIVTAAS